MRLAERALRAGYRLHSFDTIGSTNAEGLARAQAGDPGRLWLTAAVQTAGRGRQGRGWSSPSGNLHSSLLLVEAAREAFAPQLALVAAVALFDAVATVIGGAGDLRIKWPNDLLWGGAKLAGILVEGTRTRAGRPALVVGLGVNCASYPQGLPYAATSLAEIAGHSLSPATLFEALSGTMFDTVTAWAAGDGFIDIRQRWLARAHPPGTAIAVTRNGERVTGTFEGLDPEGRLLLSTGAGTLTIQAGDVFLISSRPQPADLVTSND